MLTAPLPPLPLPGCQQPWCTLDVTKSALLELQWLRYKGPWRLLLLLWLGAQSIFIDSDAIFGMCLDDEKQSFMMKGNLLLGFGIGAWLAITNASKASEILLNSSSPLELLSDLLLDGNSLILLGSVISPSWNTLFNWSSTNPGGVLKKWRILEGGCILFLDAISGLMNLLFLLPI